MLRGINISGHRMIRMDALKALYADMGFKNTVTYIQSGNVIFQSQPAIISELEKIISDGIREKFGFDVPVIIKEMEELRHIIEANPFLIEPVKEISKIYLTFLSSVPKKELYEKMSEGQNYEEEYQLIGNTIFIYCPNGYGNTKLSTNFIENKLKVTATSRNWKTTLELLRMAEKLCSQII